MKKKIALLTILFLITSYLFAGDYDSRELHKTSNGHTVHAKVFFPKNLSSKMNDDPVKFLIDLYLKEGESPITWNVTEIWLPNGIYYRINFGYHSYPNVGLVEVMKGHLSIDGPMELIYQFEGTRYSTYNTYYDVYQSQCNKYLNMY
ncbi:MAG: hypothetical protein J5857_01535 [Treponema sp.]|nr:hypothetical protein [Treponema sp.]